MTHNKYIHEHTRKQVFAFDHQVAVYSWAQFDPVCSLKSDALLVPGGSAVVIFKQPVAALLAGCGGCTRATCFLTFHLEDSSGQQGPTNHHFLCSPKDAAGLQRPNITVSLFGGKVIPDIYSSSASYIWRFSAASMGR